MQEILIKNIMTALVQCASPSTPLSHVIQSMKLSHHSCKVITENDRPIGTLTERDIVHHVTELVAKGKEHDPAVGSVMSAHPVTIHENATLFEALVVAKSNRIRHLPVINSQGHLVGRRSAQDRKPPLHGSGSRSHPLLRHSVSASLCGCPL
jgi:CBS domain-containing protein